MFYGHLCAYGRLNGPSEFYIIEYIKHYMVIDIEANQIHTNSNIL